MTKGEIYTCDHIKEELTVKEVYDKGMAKLETLSGRSFLARQNHFEEPRLCLAHVFKDDTLLRKKEKEFKW